MTQNDRVLGIVGNAAIKIPARVASTSNLTLSGEQTVNSVACVTGDRVLVKSQTDGTENGIWVVDTGAWERAPDFDGSYDIVQGTLVPVYTGSGTYQLFAVSVADPVIGNSLTFETVDDVALSAQLASTASTSLGAYLVGWIRAATSAVAATVGSWLSWQDYHVFEFMTIAQIADVQGSAVLDHASAVLAAVTAASGKTLKFANGTYNLGSGLGTIPANTRFQGANKAATRIRRTFSGSQLMTWADSVSMDNIWLAGNGATYTGKGVVIGGTDGNQNCTDCRIIDFDGNPVEFTATTAGSRSNWDNIEAWQTNGSTGSGKYAFVNADGVQLAAVPKSFHHIETSGKCAFDFGGSADVFISNSFIGDLNYTVNTKAAHISTSRIANQVALTMLGDNNTITGSDIFPNITLSGVGPYALQGNTYNGTVTDSSSNMNNSITAPSVSYTPAWTGSVSDPAIGNGSLHGEYTRNGDTITVGIDLTIGTTTTFGTGNWRFSVPVAPKLPSSSLTQIGTAFLSDSSASATEFGWVRIIVNNAYFEIHIRGGTSLVTSAAPWTWATGDIIRATIVYQL